MRKGEAEKNLSILRENIRIPYELIILDNSPEASSFDLRSNERYIFNGENLGTAARNKGILEAEGKYVLQLDDDSHPLPGSVESAIKLIESSDDNTAGINACVIKEDSSVENTPLLPSIFHGCGVLLRKSAMMKLMPFYPEDFCFYGEEYWSTLKLYAAGFRFKYDEKFKVCHRFSPSGRSVAKIIYRLAVNNRRTWRPFVPEIYLEKAEFDTSRRYELIAIKENVKESSDSANSEDIGKIECSKPMSVKDFEDFALISEMRKLIANGRFDRRKPVMLCGCGKFPTLWASIFEEAGFPEVGIADFNPGLVGKTYGKYIISGSDDAATAISGAFQAVTGHVSRGDSARWEKLLSAKSLKFTNCLS